LATRTAVAHGQRRSVLLVEDDEATSQAIGELLELEGYGVRRVRNGADAIDALHDFTPDVVLVDLQLPVMDGRSFIELYRRRVRPAASVVVMSGRHDGLAIAQSVGADGYVRKPLEIGELVRAISLALAAA
jgi:two-component system response regulator MtrA